MRTSLTVLVLATVFYAVAVQAHPNHTHSPSGCLPLSNTAAAGRAFVELYAGDSLVAAEDLAVISALLAGRARIDSEREWRLCVGVGAQQEGRVAEAPGALGGRKGADPAAIALTEEPAAASVIAVVVNFLEDSEANATACMGPTGQCNFRSAMAFCEPFSSTAGDECVVEFPAGETMYLDPSLGDIGIEARAGAITVVGNGCTVAPSPDASGPMRMLRIDTSSIILTSALTIRNLTVHSFETDIADDRDDDEAAGGVIWAHNVGSVVVESVRIADTRGGNGGSIFVRSCDSVTITGCSFANTLSSFDGGAVYITSSKRVSITNCTFFNSSAQGSGGAISIALFNRFVNISDCIFSDTAAALDGGAVLLLSGNNNVTISYCSFDDLWCGRNGGAIALLSYQTGTIITSSTFSRIRALNAGGIGLLTGNVETQITNCIFDDVSCDFAGGAIGLNSNNIGMVVSDCSFFRTTANLGGGVALNFLNSDISVSQCVFHETSSLSDGGGIYLYSRNKQVSVSDCVFNNTVSGDDGGGIYLFSSNYGFSVEGCLFSGCKTSDQGGAMYMSSNNDFSLVLRSNITRCFAVRGGAIVVGSGHSLVQLVFVACVGNVAVSDGGALLVQDSNNDFDVDNCHFERNTAGEYGGAVVIISSNSGVKISNSAFLNNVADSGGGAIQSLLSNSDFTIDQCSFDNNKAGFGGAVYFGEYHNGIAVAASSFSSNSGDYGAALYITQFNGGVSITDSVLMLNSASVQGGALFVLVEDLVVRDTTFSGNDASSSGAVYARVGAISVLNCVFVGNEGPFGSHGGMYVEDAASVVVRSTEFISNRAESGGAFTCRNCEESLFSNCSFEGNEAFGFGGGSLQFTESRTLIETSCFIGNVAVTDGGAIRAEGMPEIIILGSTFQANRAESGSGSAIWLSASANASIASNHFGENVAPLGGGALFWEVHSDMSEPFNVSKANQFTSSNVALYGNDVATDAFDLRLSGQNSYHVSDYNAYIPPIAVYVVDYYDQVVKTESEYQVVAQLLSPVKCYDNTVGFVTGGFVEQLSGGLSNFTELLASCDPGYEMPVNLTCTRSDSVLYTYFTLSFRECVRGEYFGDSVCIECEEGTYSLTDPATTPLDDLGKQVCQPCPDGSSSCVGDTIVLEEGYWRISETATTTLKCPYRDSCGGGAAAGDELCLEGYEGPVCGVCSDGYSYRTSTQRCESCRKTAGFDAVLIVLLSVFLIAGGALAYLYFCTDLRDQLKTMDDVYAFLFLRLGMLSDDPTSVWDEKRGSALREEARAAGRVFKARLKIYITLWQIVSLLPLTLDLQFPNVYTAIASTLNVFNLNVSKSSLVTCSAGHSYDAIDALVVDTVYPAILVGVLWLAFKIHLKLNETSASPVEVPKLRSRYFTIFLVFIYIILPFTSVQIFQVFSCRDVDPDDVESGDDRYMTVDYSVSCSSAKYEFGYIWAIVSVFVYPVGVPVFYFYELYCSRHDIMRRNDTSASVTEVDERTARLNPLRLLFEFYSPNLWYWEVVETVYRLLLTGVLVVIAHGSAVQIIVGVAVSLAFLKLCDNYNPYIDEKVQTLKEVSQWQIFAVFFIALLLAADFDSVHPVALDVLFVMAIVANFVLDVAHVVWRKYIVVSVGPCVEKSQTGDLGCGGLASHGNQDSACEVENPIMCTSALGIVESPAGIDVIDDDGVRMSTF